MNKNTKFIGHADFLLFILVAFLMGIGLVFSYSLPIYLELKHNWGEFYFFLKFLKFATLGLIFMFFLSQCNPDKCIAPIAWTLLIGSTLLMAFMATPWSEPFCPVIKGARRWFKIFGFTIAPIEFFKIGIIYAFAWTFSRKFINVKFNTFKEELSAILPHIILLGFIGGFIIVFQNDLGETLLISSIFIIMLLFTKVSGKTFKILMSGFSFLVLIGVLLAPYRLSRINSNIASIYVLLPKSVQDFLNWDLSENDISYQIRQSINAIYNGGLHGLGIGNGQIKLGFLSDVHTDFVLAGIAEESGFIGILIVLSLLTFLIIRILKIANNIDLHTHNDNVFRLFVVGIAVLVALETVLNIMGIVGLFPLKGLPIPFISYGGSSLMAFSIAIGMVLMISKKAKYH